MNRIEKNLIETVSKEITTPYSNIKVVDQSTVEILLTVFSILRKIGITKEQADEIFKGFLTQKYFTKFDKSDSKQWIITADYRKLIELFDKSVEGNKLSTAQSRIRQGMERKLESIRRRSDLSHFNQTLKQQFDSGKWLRFCCASCGDFIQEITSYQELKELEDSTIECPRKHHKNRYKLDGETILFNSESTKILEILKEKKVDNSLGDGSLLS